jgi:CBS domain-containing protein
MENPRDIFAAPISDLQPKNPITIEVGSSLSEAVRCMQKHRIGALLVTQQGILVGILTERDLVLKVLGRDVSLSAAVDDLMTHHPETLESDHPIAFALNRMSLGGYRHVPIVDGGGRASGIISVKDVVDYVVEQFPGEVYNLPPEPGVVGMRPEGA